MLRRAAVFPVRAAATLVALVIVAAICLVGLLWGGILAVWPDDNRHVDW